MFGRNRSRILDTLAREGELDSVSLQRSARVGPASFYAAVLRLEREGLVAQRFSEDLVPERGRRRRSYYRLVPEVKG